MVTFPRPTAAAPPVAPRSRAPAPAPEPQTRVRALRKVRARPAPSPPAATPLEFQARVRRRRRLSRTGETARGRIVGLVRHRLTPAAPGAREGHRARRPDG